MPTFLEEKWRKLGTAMLETVGASRSETDVMVDIMVKASLRGVDSHGVRNFHRIIQRIQSGMYKLGVEMKVLKEASATALLDAGHALGPVSMKRASEIAMGKAETHGIGSCSVVNGEWILGLFYYSMMIAEHDMIGIVLAREGPVCVPWGGTKPIGGTNPMSVAIPAGEEKSIVLDFATTMVAQGHVLTLLLEGKPIPEGWLVDRQGRPVKGFDLKRQDIDEFWKTGGALLPFGTYKGYGINLAIDVLCGALNMSGTSSRAKGQGAFVMAVDIGAFVPVEEFKAEVDRLIRDVKSSPVAPGFKEVLLPGEREYTIAEIRRKEGIPIDEMSWQRTLETCEELGLDVKKTME